MKKLALKRAPLPVRTQLGECDVGDEVIDQAGTPLVITSFLCGRVFVRKWDPERGKSCSDPFFVPLEAPVTLVRRGVERWPKQRGDGAEVDPLRRSS